MCHTKVMVVKMMLFLKRLHIYRQIYNAVTSASRKIQRSQYGDGSHYFSWYHLAYVPRWAFFAIAINNTHQAMIIMQNRQCELTL